MDFRFFEFCTLVNYKIGLWGPFGKVITLPSNSYGLLMFIYEFIALAILMLVENGIQGVDRLENVFAIL